MFLKNSGAPAPITEIVGGFSFLFRSVFVVCLGRGIVHRPQAFYRPVHVNSPKFYPPRMSLAISGFKRWTFGIMLTSMTSRRAWQGHFFLSSGLALSLGEKLVSIANDSPSIFFILFRLFPSESENPIAPHFARIGWRCFKACL